MSTPNQGRELPPKYRHDVKIEWFRKFSLKERIQIFFGFNLVVNARILCVNSPGRWHGQLAGRTTKEKKASEFVNESYKDQAK